MSEFDPKSPFRLTFDYEKSSNFRVIHVDGVHGGVAPDSSGLILSLFNQRRPIPRREEYDVTDGQLVRDDKATKDRGCHVLREVEVCAILSISAAVTLHGWLADKIAEYQKIQEAAKALQEGKEGRDE